MPDGSVLRLLMWTAGAVRCGVPIDRLARIVPLEGVTPVPGAPPAVLGIANVQGELVTVVDGRLLIGEPARGTAPELVLVDRGGRYAGIAVDAVEDIVEVDESALAREPDGTLVAASPGGGRLRVLDLDGLLDPLIPA